MRVYEDNGRSVAMVKGSLWKFWWFSSNGFLIALVVSFRILILVLGGRGYGRSKKGKI